MEIFCNQQIFEDYEESPLSKLVAESNRIVLKRDPVIFQHLIWYLENQLKLPCHPLTRTGEPHLGTVHKLKDFRNELEYWQLEVPILLDLITIFKSKPSGVSPSALGKWKEMGPVDLA